MKTFISGECTTDKIFTLIDPTSFSEAEFEGHVQAALRCVYPDYFCVPFRGAFSFDEEIFEADLALVHRSFSHWFVLEVELVSHSLQHHVLPQVRAFRFGRPLDSCVTYLCRHVPGVDMMRAQSLLRYVPKNVAVIANRTDPEWTVALRGCDVQSLTVSVFRKSDGGLAHETEGSLYVPHESLGFFSYSASNRSFRVPLGTALSEGEIQIEDPNGAVGIWIVRSSLDALWVTKQVGDPGIPNNSLLQILKTHTGRITMRLPSSG